MRSALVFKAFSDPLRLRILSLLARRDELCVCDLTEALGVPQSSISRHLGMLRHLEVVESRRDGRWVHYRLNGGLACAPALHALLRDLAADEPALVEDAARLERVETVCR